MIIYIISLKRFLGPDSINENTDVGSSSATKSRLAIESFSAVGALLHDSGDESRLVFWVLTVRSPSLVMFEALDGSLGEFSVTVVSVRFGSVDHLASVLPLVQLEAVIVVDTSVVQVPFL